MDHGIQAELAEIKRQFGIQKRRSQLLVTAWIATISLGLLGAAYQQEKSSAATTDREYIEDTLKNFAFRTDDKDWRGVQNLFTPVVRFTMSGNPKDTPVQEMTAIWENALKDIPVVHHQLGNILIAVRGDQAEAKYYGISLQYKPSAKNGDIRGYVGVYQVHLIRTAGDWKIDGLEYKNKITGGNLNLE